MHLDHGLEYIKFQLVRTKIDKFSEFNFKSQLSN